MSKPVYIISLFFLFSLHNLYAQEKTYEVLRNGFNFKINVIEGYGSRSILSIDIVNTTLQEKLQTIDVESNMLFYTEGIIEEIIIMEDENFDGYLDFRFPKNEFANGEMDYFHWVYSPNKNIFIRDKELEMLTNPFFDSKTQTIISQWHTNNQEQETHYQYVNGKIEMVWQRDVQTVGETWEIIKEKVNGKWITSRKKIAD